MRDRRFLTGLLALLLLMQWGTAFAHCLKLVGPPSAIAVEICTPDGLRHAALPLEDGGTAHGDMVAAGFCPACQGPAAVALPAPPVTLAPPVLLVQSADPPPPSSPAPGPLPPRSCQPRAPPPTS